MQEKIREIVSIFIKIPAAEIGPSTPIDRAAIGNSILVHRMYAKLAEEGLRIENYVSVRTFSDLWLQADADRLRSSGEPIITDPVIAGHNTVEGGIGIDIQEITALPRTHDFRRDEFYKMNFDPSEIAYCILQPDPYASFAGLFAVKEAMVKSAAQYRGKSFNSILIDHLPGGRPVHPGFHLSISHTGNMAVAVALPSATGQLQAPIPGGMPPPAENKPLAFWLALSALILSAVALLILFIH
jgi:phosphopantetheine--protein transferase-like protein